MSPRRSRGPVGPAARIGDVGGNVVALWPAELKEQAKYLYGRRLGRLFIVAASIAALAVPTATLASAPAIPGGFGTERASNIQQFHTGDDG